MSRTCTARWPTSAETSTRPSPATSHIFKAITGGDPIAAEYKFGASFFFHPFCRLIFSANALPNTRDTSQGFFDRWYVVQFPNRFRNTPGEVPLDELVQSLTTPAELSGLLNRALAVLPDVRAHGLTKTPSVKEMCREFRAENDPVQAWLDTNVVYAPDGQLASTELLKAYNSYRATVLLSSGFSRKPINAKQFAASVEAWDSRIVAGGRGRVAGKQVRMFTHIDWLPKKSKSNKTKTTRSKSSKSQSKRTK